MPYVLSAVQDIKGTQTKYIPGAAHRILWEWIRPKEMRLRRLASVIVQGYNADDRWGLGTYPAECLHRASNGGTEVVPRIFFRPRWISVHECMNGDIIGAFFIFREVPAENVPDKNTLSRKDLTS